MVYFLTFLRFRNRSANCFYFSNDSMMLIYNSKPLESQQKYESYLGASKQVLIWCVQVWFIFLLRNHVFLEAPIQKIDDDWVSRQKQVFFCSFFAVSLSLSLFLTFQKLIFLTKSSDVMTHFQDLSNSDHTTSVGSLNDKIIYMA